MRGSSKERHIHWLRVGWKGCYHMWVNSCFTLHWPSIMGPPVLVVCLINNQRGVHYWSRECVSQPEVFLVGHISDLWRICSQVQWNLSILWMTVYWLGSIGRYKKQNIRKWQKGHISNGVGGEQTIFSLWTISLLLPFLQTGFDVKVEPQKTAFTVYKYNSSGRPLPLRRPLSGV